MTDVKTTTVFAEDDATSKKADDACEFRFVCHPICETITDSRGCVAECRCDDVVSSLADMQQQEQQLDVLAESESRLMCTTANSVCSCDVDEEEEQWTVDDDGCLTCVCVTPAATTSDISRSRVEHTTPMTTTTAHTSTSSTADTTTQVKTSTVTTVTTTMTSTSQQEVTTAPSTVATSSVVNVECRQLLDGHCAGVTCGKAGYAKDENGCDVCSCAVTVKEEEEPTKTVYHVVAAARKGTITLVI